MEFDKLDENSMDGVNDTHIIHILHKSITNILKSKFPTDYEKQSISHRTNRINFACPICGDSSTSSTKKRGNIYIGNGFRYMCYNICGSMPLSQFFRSLNVEFPFDDRSLLYISSSHNNYISHNISNNRNNNYFKNLLEIDKYAIPIPIIEKLFNLKKIQDDKVAYEFIKSRNQLSYISNLRSNKYGIYILNMFDDKVISLQTRYYKGDYRYLSKRYSRILKHMNVDSSKIDPQYLSMMDNLSNYYGIFGVDFSKSVYVFEGAFDSHHIPNSIATLSASNDIIFDNAVYFFDNDDAGRKKSIAKLEKGHKVFLWSSFLNDHGNYNPMKPRDYHKDIYDGMDLDDIIRLNLCDIPTLYKYFSNDISDMLYV